MLQQVGVDHFKAFERFTLNIRGDALLAGPNNAGKSTLIAAIRTGARMIRHAEQRVASYDVLDKGNRVVAHLFPYGRFGLVEENLRHEFRNEESRMSFRFANGVRLIAVWPPDPEDLDPFFYLLDGDVALRAPADVRRLTPSIGIVPVLAPVDHQEAVLTSEKYVRENLDGRLASRHFRNQLLLLQDGPAGEDYDAFLNFAEPWLPELRLDRPKSRMGQGGVYIDLFFKEYGSRIDKEVFWAGDGLQIWLQLLLHLFRLRHNNIIVLDEPDVFLHPDLQRRLVHLLESVDAQTIAATHSPELLAEAPPESIVWVDKVRRRSIRAPDSAVLNELMNSIGTQFNIRLARALRAKRVLFVEGEDMKILRHLAEAVGATRLAREAEIAVIPLKGYSNWDRIEPFVWLVRDLLEDSVEVFVVLDRDYRTSEQARNVQDRLSEIGVHAHVWRRKELESYLLEPRVIGALLGTDEHDASERLAACTAPMLQTVAHAAAFERSRGQSARAASKTRERVDAEFASIWSDPGKRLWLCPPKDVLASMNRQLEAEKTKAITFPRLARSMGQDDVPAEVRALLLKVDGAGD